MKTVGKKQRRGERSRALCDRCGTIWDRRLLRTDGEGMLVCPQEGNGRDGATLTRANAAAARAAADRLRPDHYYPGRYPREEATPIASLLGSISTEDLRPILTEDGDLITVE